MADGQVPGPGVLPSDTPQVDPCRRNKRRVEDGGGGKRWTKVDVYEVMVASQVSPFESINPHRLERTPSPAHFSPEVEKDPGLRVDE